MTIFYIIMIFLFLIAFNITIDIKNIDNETYFKIKYLIFKKNLNYEKIKDFLNKYKDELTIKNLYEDIKNIINKKPIYKQIIINSKITKFKIITKSNIKDIILNQYFKSTTLIIYSFIKEYLINNTMYFYNDELKIEENNIKNLDIDFHIIIKIKVVDILIILLKNLINNILLKLKWSR